MKPRDRVHAVLGHREADRVPLDLWITPAAYEKVRNYLRITAPEAQEWGVMSSWKISEALLNRLHVDFRRVYMRGASSFKPKTYQDGSVDTEYGFRGKWIGPYWEIVHHPWAQFTEIEQVMQYEWPNVNDPSRMDGVVEWARHLHEDTDCAVVGMVGAPWGVLEICEHYMRGYEAFLLDLTTRRDLAEAMMDKCMKYAMDMNRVFLDQVGQYLDIVQVGDDLGHQQGMIVGPKMYRDLIKPRHKRIYGDIHKRTPHVKMLFHSCGAIEPIINDLIEVGVDILNPVEPLAKGMDSATLKRKYGDRISFHGGVDLQEAMSIVGTIATVRKEIDTRLRAFAPGGGYILAPAHDIQPDSTPEKIVDMYDYAFRKGRYPIRV